MHSTILVFVETKSGKIKKTSLELLGEANSLAPQFPGSIVQALLIGDGLDNATTEVGGYCKFAFEANHAGYKDYNVHKYASVVVEACKRSNAVVLLATASSVGRDLMPRVAARLNTGMITECTSLSVKDGKLVAQRPIYAGKALVEVTVTSSPAVVTCRPNVFAIPTPQYPGMPRPNVMSLNEFASMETPARVVETIASKSDKPDLTEASIIVAAGRAIKSADNFKLINELADVLGAAVGASRAAVDAGYIAHSSQVGQTGKTVNPKLYICFGISGAIQHLAGMQTSKVIVAVNSDPEAPIFAKADYGIVGDLFEILPIMTGELRKLLKE